MFDIYSNRRDFLRIGGIGAGFSSIGLSDLAHQKKTAFQMNIGHKEVP